MPQRRIAVRDRGGPVGSRFALCTQHHEAPLRNAANGQRGQLLGDGLDALHRRKMRGGVDDEPHVCVCALLRIDVGGGSNPPLHATAAILHRRSATDEPSIRAVIFGTQPVFHFVGHSGRDRALPTLPRMRKVVRMHDAFLSVAAHAVNGQPGVGKPRRVEKFYGSVRCGDPCQLRHRFNDGAKLLVGRTVVARTRIVDGAQVHQSSAQRDRIVCGVVERRDDQLRASTALEAQLQFHRA